MKVCGLWRVFAINMRWLCSNNGRIEDMAFSVVNSIGLAFIHRSLTDIIILTFLFPAVKVFGFTVSAGRTVGAIRNEVVIPVGAGRFVVIWPAPRVIW